MSKNTDKIKKGLTESPPSGASKIAAYLSSGCTLIDLVMGGAPGVFGYKRGVFHRISGTKAAGKTFLVSEVGALAKRRYGDKADVAIQDCEARNTMDTEKLYGVPRDELISENPPVSVEDLDAHLGVYLKGIRKNTVGIYAIDSLESLTNANVENRTAERQKKYQDGKDVVDKGDMGMQSAKFFSQEFFRTKKNALGNTDATCFLLSQMRENVDRKTPYSPKYKTTGGPSIEHWCDSASELKVVQQIGDKDRPIGAVVELKTTKLTAPRPYRSCRYTVYYTFGIDNIGSNIDYLYDLRGERGDLSETKAKSLSWEGKEISTSLIKEWVEKFDEDNETNLLKECKNARKKEDGKTGISIDFHQKYFRNHEAPLVQESFCSAFGEQAAKTYTRDELIQACEDDPDMEKELHNKVVEKWEAIETAAAAPIAGRRRRF
jgi:polyhydroxyalkanoate synthesis regulator phasin